MCVFQVWSHLLHIEFGSENYTDQWRQHLLQWLKDRIEKVWWLMSTFEVVVASQLTLQVSLF